MARSRPMFCAFTYLLAAILPVAAFAIEQGQVDDFEDGSTMGWREGIQSPNPPTNVSDGGPGGAGDHYLADTSDGSTSGPGGKFVMFNRLQWAGDYVAAGVNAITVQLANFGNAPLPLRLALSSGSGDQWGSAEAFMLPDDGQWHEHTFRLTTGGMAAISASGTLDDALSNVSELRVLAAALGPNWRGDAVVASIGVDDMQAVSLIIANDEASWSSLKKSFQE